MAGIDAALLAAGYRPGPARKRNFLDILETIVGGYQQYQKAQAERQQKMLDMYKTMREAGYDIKTSHEATIGKLGWPEPGQTPEEQKLQAQTEKEKALAERYRTPTVVDEATRAKQLELLQTRIDKLKAVSPTEELEKQKLQTQIEETQARIDRLKQAPLKEVTLTESGKFRQAIQQARRGEIDWEDVEMDYPDRIETIKKLKKQLTPVSKSSSFREGTGGLISRIKSKISPYMAEIDSQTKKVIDNIRTEADLEELNKNRRAYEDAGVDVAAILEYFGEI